MDENKRERNDTTVEIDVQRLFRALIGRVWLICIVSVLCAVMLFSYTLFFVTPQYKSSAMFYVNNSSLSLGDVSLSYQDITASRSLVETYIVILNTRETLEDVIDYSGVDISYSALRGMISSSAVDETEIFEIVVTHPDPETAEKLADAIAYILPKRIANIIDGTSAKIVDAAVLPSSPSSPNITKNTLIGFAIGFLLAAAYVVIREMMDITIRSEDEIAQCCKLPVLASVPDMEDHHSKSSGYYGYRKKGAYQKAAPEQKQTILVGDNISFFASEAYKLLRTKIQFSFADEGGCRVIGFSSALAGEGKSLSASNLAYSMAQLGKKVLLVECDMRRPSLGAKLGLEQSPGLSDYLTAQCSSKDIIQVCSLSSQDGSFNAISSGRTPPNPMELLSSPKMQRMIEKMRAEYDYVILDLPPVGEVGDALAVAGLTDGMLVVVRSNYCDRIVLNSAIRQLEFVDTKLLGIVFNCTIDEGTGYGRRYYYKKYHRRYYKRYYGRYAGKYYGKYYSRYAAQANDAQNNAAENKAEPKNDGNKK